MTLEKISKKALEEYPISKEDALYLLDLDDGELPVLLNTASALRRKYKGDFVGIQILSNAKSGNCAQDCAYCAQSRDSAAPIERYPLVPFEKLLSTSRIAREKRLARHCIGLSGIKFTDGEIEAFAESVRRLKAQDTTHICCSIGFLTEKQAQTLKEAGVDRINHNLNTGRNYYPNICSTHSYEERVQNIKMLKNLGFEICSGGILGLGEAKEDVADMFLELRELSPESVPVNFLVPLGGTRLEGKDTSALTPEYCLKALSLARIMCPKSDIRAAAGREIYLKGMEEEMFSVADSIFASGYLTTGGESVESAIRLVKDAGYRHIVE